MGAVISIAVAMDEARGIGRAEALPWRLKSDLALFKVNTVGKTVLMGRATANAIGRTLPNRRNLVLSRRSDPVYPGQELVHSLDEALTMAHEELVVIGGGQVYAQVLPMASRIYLTQVHAVCNADTYFPELRWNEYSITEEQQYPAGPGDEYAFTYRLLERLATT